MRFLDVIGGIAEGVDETLSKSIDESNKFAREVKLRKIERRDAAEDIYQKDLREARKVMDTLSGITGGDAGKAAQLFKLGGSSAGAQNIANLINEEQLKMGDDFNLDTMIGFVETETKGFGVEDYLTKLVRRPEELISTPSEERVGGTGLYEALFKPDYSKEIQRGVEAASPFTPSKEVEGLDIQTAKLLETTASETYKREKNIAEVQLENAILNNRKLEADIAQLGLMTGADFRRSFDKVLSASLDNAGHLYDPESRSFDIDTSEKKYQSAIDAFNYSIQSMAKRALETGASNKKDIRNELYTAAKLVQPYYTPETDYQIPNLPENPEVGRIYAIEEEDTNYKGAVLFLGIDNYIKLD